MNQPTVCAVMLTADRPELARRELRCIVCGDGMRFDQQQCDTCGEMNPRYRA